jgi:hypothetical protein
VSTTTPSAQQREELDLLLRGFQVSRMLRLIADLGVADKIGRDAAVSVHELAAACGVLADPLVRVLRALASFRIFCISTEGLVSHTAYSILLRTDTPNSFHHAARFWAGPGSWRAWGELDAAMTGKTPHNSAWGISRFDYLRQHPGEARAFEAMMATFPDNRHAAIAEAYDFTDARVIADIGGGNGAGLRHILSRFPNSRGLVFDREDVVAELTQDDLMGGRISAQGGSFFDSVPRGADAYLLVRVLHDWNDEDCVSILRVCHGAMEANSVLLVCDHLLEPDPLVGQAMDYLLDMQMMAMFGDARERTTSEFERLFDESGFSLASIIRTRSPVSVIVARPVVGSKG